MGSFKARLLPVYTINDETIVERAERDPSNLNLSSALNMLSATLFPRPNSRASFLVIHFVRNYSVPAGHQVPNKKVWDSVDAAVGAVKSGDVLLSGGMPLRPVSSVGP